MTERKAALITGLGVVSAAGVGALALAQALREARCCLSPAEHVAGGDWPFRLVGRVTALDPSSSEAKASRLDRVSQMALLAAREALANAQLDLSRPRMDGRIAIIVGTAGGGLESIDAGYQVVLGEGRRRPSPFTVPRSMPSAPVSTLAAEWKISGPAFAVSSACASSNHAIALGAQFIRAGVCDVAIVGGAEAPLTFGHLRAWEALRALSADTCRPFSRDRSGLVLSEGAAIVVLESPEHAAGRGINAWAELLGFGMSSGAADVTKSDAQSYMTAMSRALADAGIDAGAIDYVNAHGTGTPLNDVAEAQALHAVFGERASTLAVSSTKSQVGHAIGASGAIELCATLIGMREGFFPPTVNFTASDPACLLDVVPNAARPGKFRTALSNSFAFGDLNATLVVRGVS